MQKTTKKVYGKRALFIFYLKHFCIIYFYIGLVLPLSVFKINK